MLLLAGAGSGTPSVAQVLLLALHCNQLNRAVNGLTGARTACTLQAALLPALMSARATGSRRTTRRSHQALTGEAQLLRSLQLWLHCAIAGYVPAWNSSVSRAPAAAGMLTARMAVLPCLCVGLLYVSVAPTCAHTPGLVFSPQTLPML
jgi:hypothetical protein